MKYDFIAIAYSVSTKQFEMVNASAITKSFTWEKKATVLLECWERMEYYSEEIFKQRLRDNDLVFQSKIVVSVSS